ncbi:hypothetical protein BGW80DRAFT_450353 [Lactifluus volemus]|nr:hypothetical protein BGW80DRAFT_1259067 [Lactifluus volemus]KAH9953914.1 hypothetical protein BGW80DRAFT_450353 [Lactifluus volemus]
MPPPPRLFPLAKLLARNMMHVYSPAKPGPLSWILFLAALPESTAAAPPPPHQKNQNNHTIFVPATAVFKLPPPPPAPLLLRPGAASNAATTRPRAKRHASGNAELDVDIDVNVNVAAAAAQHPNLNSDLAAITVAGDGGDVMEVEDVGGAGRTRDPRALEKENTIRRRLKGPVAAAKTRKLVTKSVAPHKSAPVPAESAMVELGWVGGAASGLLLVAARGGGAAAGGTMVNGLWHVPIDSAEAAAAAEGVPA